MFPERPERLRAIKVGTAAIVGRLLASASAVDFQGTKWSEHQAGDTIDSLSAGLKNLDVAEGASKSRKRKFLDMIGVQQPFDILSSPRLTSFRDPALLYVHQGLSTDIDTTTSKEHTSYPSQLESWCLKAPASAPTSSTPHELEIPPYLPSGDLYLARSSSLAIRGSLGAMADANDLVFSPESTHDKSFVAVRPPGHHCGESNPQGFCWVNTVAFGIVDAYMRHGVNKAIIFDIDLHHGNGTQEVAWEINRRYTQAVSTAKKGTPKKGKEDTPKSVLQVFYGSLHDINSYPCEAGLDEFVIPASTNISGGPTNQYISNVHLEPYKDANDFYERLYPTYWAGLGGKALEFLRKTNTTELDKVGIWISAGFDASEFEMDTMSRHKVKVPTSFYSRIARDTVILSHTIPTIFSSAANFSQASLKRSARRTAPPSQETKPFRRPSIISVLEGGYSDRALTSGVASLLQGLVWEEVGGSMDEEKEEWWAAKEWLKLEKACAPAHEENGDTPKRKARQVKRDDWVEYAKAIFAELEKEVSETTGMMKDELEKERPIQTPQTDKPVAFPV
ncbi:Arginase/deacetylase, partial [Atractiella rhizophila]